ncbi:hypothetical protein HYFRA_00006211 [Hymenoscyphus fraxineus]|uniref:Uncharacterized protein n=1 Tax=Hymenoscyphus fraxineus TaxID=746836 RepID=A0A9N9L9Q8_9HELO|nr:hypothetical protein HYFRA_00006211 [Hymenoscyphus fraxineus]
MSDNQIAQLQSDLQYYTNEVTTLRNHSQQLQHQNHQLVAEIQRLKVESYELYRSNDALQAQLSHYTQPPPSPAPNQEKDFTIQRLEQEVARLEQRVLAEKAVFKNFASQIELVFEQEDQMLIDAFAEVRELKHAVDSGGEDRRGLLDAINDRDTQILQQQVEIRNLRESLLKMAKRKAA